MALLLSHAPQIRMGGLCDRDDLVHTARWGGRVYGNGKKAVVCWYGLSEPQVTQIEGTTVDGAYIHRPSEAGLSTLSLVGYRIPADTPFWEVVTVLGEVSKYFWFPSVRRSMFDLTKSLIIHSVKPPCSVLTGHNRSHLQPLIFKPPSGSFLGAWRPLTPHPPPPHA